METDEHVFWVYGALVLAFVCIGVLFKKIYSLEKTSIDFKVHLPLINQKLDEMNATLKLFLKQEIDTLKDMSKKL